MVVGSMLNIRCSYLLVEIVDFADSLNLCGSTRREEH